MDGQKPPTGPHGVVITFYPDDLEINLGIIREWFDDRTDVAIIDSGVSDKKGEGIIIMRFDQGYPERWFLHNLEQDDTIFDFTVYEDEE